MTELKRKSDLLNDHEKAEIDRWLAKYPEDQKPSAVLAALRELMHTDGYLKNEKMDAVAEYLDMPEIAVYEVGSFYSMYELKPIGRHTISVCTNVSCMLCGSDKIVDHIEKKLPSRSLGDLEKDPGVFRTPRLSEKKVPPQA